MRRILVALVVVVVAGGAAGWWFFLRSTAPPEAQLEACDSIAGGADVPPEGPWQVVAGEDRFVGYRIRETFGGDALERTAAGRTPTVSGGFSLQGDSVSSVDITADLTDLESDQARRERYLQNSALEVSDFPTAVFTLEAVQVSTVGAAGQKVPLDLEGDLTLHGVTAPVTVTLEACWTGESIDVAGSAPIALADFEIEPPDIAGLVSVRDAGRFEMQLRFEPV